MRKKKKENGYNFVLVENEERVNLNGRTPERAVYWPSSHLPCNRLLPSGNTTPGHRKPFLTTQVSNFAPTRPQEAMECDNRYVTNIVVVTLANQRF